MQINIREVLQELNHEAQFESSASLTLLLNTVAHLDTQAKKKNKSSTEYAYLMKGVKDALVAEGKRLFSVNRYFTGHGRVGSILRQRLAEEQLLIAGMDSAHPLYRELRYRITALKQTLSNFEFNVYQDADESRRLLAFLEEVAHEVYDRRVPILEKIVPRYTGDAYKHHESGMYKSESARFGEQPASEFVLRTRLPNGVVVLFVTNSRHESHLLYFHPSENIWLVADGTVLMPGLFDLLRYEWDLVRQSLLNQKLMKVNVELEMRELREMADRIFRNDTKIPNGTLGFTRDSDVASLKIFAAPYELQFIDTRGAYPSRTTLLTQCNEDRNKLTFKVSFSDMRESDRQSLLGNARMVMSTLITKFVLDQPA